MNFTIAPRPIRKVLDVRGGQITYCLPTFAELRDIVRGEMAWGSLIEDWGGVRFHLLSPVEQRRVFDTVTAVDAD